MPGNIIDFARLGFVAMTINYRLSGEAPFPGRSTTVARRALAAGPRGIPRRRRKSACGNSAGGHLALLLAMMPERRRPPANPTPINRAPCRRRPATAGRSTWSARAPAARAVVEKFMGGTAAESGRVRRASPPSYVDQKVPPLLLIYGEVDGQVNVRTADEFVAALAAPGATMSAISAWPASTTARTRSFAWHICKASSRSSSRGR